MVVTKSGRCPVCNKETEFYYNPHITTCTDCTESFSWIEPMYPFELLEEHPYDEDLDIDRAARIIAGIIKKNGLGTNELQVLFDDIRGSVFDPAFVMERRPDWHLMKPKAKILNLIHRIIDKGRYRRMSDIDILLHNIEAESFDQYAHLGDNWEDYYGNGFSSQKPWEKPTPSGNSSKSALQAEEDVGSESELI